VGILTDASLTGSANVNDVRIATGAGNTGVLVQAASGTANFTNMNITNGGRGLYVTQGAPDVRFQGRIATDASAEESVLVEGLTGGSVMVNRTTDTLSTGVAKNESTVSTALFIVQDQGSTAPAAIQVANNTSAVVGIGPTDVSQPTQQGVAVQGNTDSTIAFFDLSISDAVAEAFLTQSNDNLSLVSIQGRSDLSSQSTAAPAFASNDDANLIVSLLSVASKTVAPTPAIRLQGASAGDFSISDSFLVETGNPSPPPATIPAPGTNANVSNSTGVTVTLP